MLHTSVTISTKYNFILLILTQRITVMIIQNIEDSDDVSNTRKGGPLAKYEAVLKEQLTVYTPMSYNARIVGKYVLSLIACSGRFKRSLQT